MSQEAKKSLTLQARLYSREKRRQSLEKKHQHSTRLTSPSPQKARVNLLDKILDLTTQEWFTEFQQLDDTLTKLLLLVAVMTD